VLEGYKVAKEIAAHGAGASTFADWWGYKIEAVDAIPYNAALMTRKGVVASINSDDAELSRHLNTEAAKSNQMGRASARTRRSRWSPSIRRNNCASTTAPARSRSARTPTS